MCPSFPFGIEGGMWDVIVLIPGHCFSIYFKVAYVNPANLIQYRITKIFSVYLRIDD